MRTSCTASSRSIRTRSKRPTSATANARRGACAVRCTAFPIALKDNILTHDIVTTGGALAFDGYVPPYEATLVKNLRDAGAVIIAKTGLSELANWVAGAPTPMPGNYNAIRGFGFNPYDPRRDPRDGSIDGRPALSTGGSSSGVGTAANFWAGNVGSETSGSILSPSNQNMLAADQAHGRPHQPLRRDPDHRRSGHRRSDGEDRDRRRDHAGRAGERRARSERRGDQDLHAAARPRLHALSQGRRIEGRAHRHSARVFLRPRRPAGGGGGGRGGRGGGGFGNGLTPEQARVMTEAIDILKQQGAVIVDPADIPSIVTKDPAQNFALWGQCSGVNNAKGKDSDCSVVLKYGMKRDFNAWLATLGASAPVKSLTELREWNITHTVAGAIRYGQSQLDISDEMDVQGDRARYEADRAKDILLAGTHGIDEVMKANHLDALLFPGAERRGHRRAARDIRR